MSYVLENIQTASEVLTSLKALEQEGQSITKGVDLLIGSLKSKNKLISCGNGGSMCDAIHFAEELSGRFRDDRPALPALSISDPGHISCVGNDYGYDFIFSRFIEAHGQTGDTLLAISTSGKSKNVIKAVEKARELGVKTLGLLGKDGGELLKLCDHSIVVPSGDTDRIQECHIKIIHCFIEGIERSFFPELYP